MAKIIIDTEVAEYLIQKYQSGDLTRALLKDLFTSGRELIYCEDCDMAYPCFSPFDRKNYVRCTYSCSGDGKVVCRNHFCSAGERRKEDAR